MHDYGRLTEGISKVCSDCQLQAGNEFFSSPTFLAVMFESDLRTQCLLDALVFEGPTLSPSPSRFTPISSFDDFQTLTKGAVTA